MDRRAFLKGVTASTSALSGWKPLSAAASAGDAPAHEMPADSYQAPEWLRYSRAIYFEGCTPPFYPHMKDFDAKRLVDVVQKLGGDTLRFEAVGFYAYYPSQILPRHPELDGRNLIEETARECRKAGIHMYCYTPYGNPTTITIEYADQHPKFKDWILRGPEGKPYGTYQLVWRGTGARTCTTGEAYREMFHGIVKELSEQDLDGVYFDAPSGYRGICFCESCREDFKKFSGIDMDRLTMFVKYGGLPLNWKGLPSNVDMEALIAWFKWANTLTEQDLLDFRQMLHRRGKFMLCHNGATWDGTSLFRQYRFPEGFMVEAFPQVFERLFAGFMGASMALPYRKLTQIYMGSHNLTWSNQVPHKHPNSLHDTDLEDEDEIRMQGFVNLASGNCPIYATANRLYYGVGGGSIEPAQDVYDVMQRAEGILKDSVSVPYVSLVPTWESLQLWRTRGKSWNMDMSQDMTLAMLDERISFDVNPSTEMNEEWLNRQTVIALCGASGISDAEAKSLGDWVARGGGLLATYDTGLYNEKGELRTDGGALRDVLAVQLKGQALEGQSECYYRVLAAHPALGNLARETLVVGDSNIVPVEATNEGKVLADCWNLGTQESRGPAIIAHEHGRGRTLYVSGSLETYYAAGRMSSLRRLLGAAIRYLGHDAPQPFTLSAPRGVYGVLRRTTRGDLALWILANVGFKDNSMGLMRQDYVPVGNVEVGIRVPEGRTVRSVNLLRRKESLPFRIEGEYARAVIPSLHIAELIHWEFA